MGAGDVRLLLLWLQLLLVGGAGDKWCLSNT